MGRGLGEGMTPGLCGVGDSSKVGPCGEKRIHKYWPSRKSSTLYLYVKPTTKRFIKFSIVGKKGLNEGN